LTNDEKHFTVQFVSRQVLVDLSPDRLFLSTHFWPASSPSLPWVRF